MEPNEFTKLCIQTHDMINGFINQLVVINADSNSTTKALLEERLVAFEFVMKLRLDFQPLFVTDSVVKELWEEIRGTPVLQEMVSTVTFKLLTHVDDDFYTKVATRLNAAVEALAGSRGEMDADYHERIIDGVTLQELIINNPWFATLLLITMGRDEYVKPSFINAV